MSSDTLVLLKELVEHLSNEVDIQFVQSKELPSLPINPFSREEAEKSRVAHYLLMAASIDIFKIVGEAENARRILCSMYDLVGERLFAEIRVEKIEGWFNFVKENYNLGEESDKIPYYISKVNCFVKEVGGDLYRWGREYKNVNELIDLIANKCNLGGPNSTRKRVCMYLRWMVRPKPDLRLWDHLSPRDLYLPLDRNVGYVLSKLGVLNKEELNYLKWKHVVKATNFAKELFPEDPAKVDYPFFLIGRWLKGRQRIGDCEKLAKTIFGRR